MEENHINDYLKSEAEDYIEFKKRPINIAMEQFSYKKKIDNLQSQGILKKEFSVVDLACGTGTYSRILRNYFDGDIVGIDLSQDMVDSANELQKNEKNNEKEIKYLQGNCLSDMSSLLENRKFDVVNACWLYNYSPSEDVLKQSIKNVKSILKDNGYFIGILTNDKIKPDSWKISEKYGSGYIPKNRDYNREKFENGEACLFVLFEPNNYCEPFKFEVQAFYYNLDCYKKAFEEAGFNFEFEPFEIEPESYTKEYEEIIDLYGVVFFAKLNKQ